MVRQNKIFRNTDESRMDEGEAAILNLWSMLFYNKEASITLLGDYKDLDHIKIKISIKNESKIFSLHEVPDKIKLDCLGLLEMHLPTPKRKLAWY
ncbi:hypothetical protein MNBD_IGNAVI01-1573 [hydrothermal vent metagenome]|uniref:Uncharacterized protein n=1 Tax=hydrothermal vent metagenome TaxID=652676 RepID=A0A3B1CG52_9ZZZZ